MKSRTLGPDALLLFTAAIWGFAFVAQREGMQHVEPFIFNGVRFALGALTLVPLLMQTKASATQPPDRQSILIGGVGAGLALFSGASLQQVGIVYTTAGKAGFITGLYVVLVPLISLMWGQHVRRGIWIGAVCAATGLYLLSVKADFSITFGDALVLLSALCWALHVHIIARFSERIGALRLAFFQYLICAVLSLVVAGLYENPTLDGLAGAAVPIIYGGVFSVGIAYTLQVIAQQKAQPGHAAIILSLESVFAVLGGWLLLGEVLSLRGLIGCGLMLSGMIISQLKP